MNNASNAGLLIYAKVGQAQHQVAMPNKVATERISCYSIYYQDLLLSFGLYFCDI